MNRNTFKIRAAILVTLGATIVIGCWLIIAKLTPKPSIIGWYKEVWYYGPLGFAVLGLIIGLGMVLIGLVALAANLLKEQRSFSSRTSHPAGRDFIQS
jgi:hypothetical protein